MAPLRFAVWGTGFFGRRWMEEIRRHPGAELAGVVSRDPSRAAAVTAEAGVGPLRGFTAVGDAGKAGIEAVVVALPPALHRDATLAALEAGLHVLLEKPLALELADARAVRRAAAARGDRVVMVDQNFRYRPHVQALRRAVREGRAGAIGRIGLVCRQAIRRTTQGGWRERMPQPYLMDFAIHHFDLLRYVTGLEPVEVYARSFRPPGSWFEGASAASAVATFTTGAMMSYDGTMVASGGLTPQEGVLTVEGDRGSLCLNGGSQVELSRGTETEPIPALPDDGGELAQALDAFLGGVRAGRAPESGIEDNFKSFAFLAAILESVATGSAVRVPSE